MKKFYTLLLLLATTACGLNAQIKVVKEDGTTVQNGEILTFQATETQDPFTGEVTEASVSPSFPAILPEDIEDEPNCEVTITINKESGSEAVVEWCGFGACETIDETVSKRTSIATYYQQIFDSTTGSFDRKIIYSDGEPAIPSTAYMQLDLSFAPGHYETVTVKVEVTSDDDPIVTYYQVYTYSDGAATTDSPLKVINKDGSVVTNGQTITITPEEDPMNPETSLIASAFYPAYVAATVGENVNYSVALTYTSEAKGASLSWCMGGDCNPVPAGGMSKGGTTATTESNGKVVPGFKDLMNLEIYFTKGNYGKVTCTVDVKAEGKQVLTYYIVGDYSETSGIAQANDKDGNISLTAGSLNYNFANGAQRTVKLYTADGRLVKQATLTGTQGSVSLNSLNAGVYVWTITEAGRTLQSGKALVR